MLRKGISQLPFPCWTCSLSHSSCQQLSVCNMIGGFSFLLPTETRLAWSFMVFLDNRMPNPTQQRGRESRVWEWKERKCLKGCHNLLQESLLQSAVTLHDIKNQSAHWDTAAVISARLFQESNIHSCSEHLSATGKPYKEKYSGQRFLKQESGRRSSRSDPSRAAPFN